jgi:hypothetical protein
MRLIFYACLLLTACAAQDVRCDRHLQPINPLHAHALPGTAAAPSAK